MHVAVALLVDVVLQADEEQVDAGDDHAPATVPMYVQVIQDLIWCLSLA